MNGVPIGEKWTAPIGDRLETYMRDRKEISIRAVAEQTAEVAKKLRQ